MAGTATTPLTLQNGIYLQSTEYDHKSHLDKAHVMSLNQGNPHATDMGIIEPFITSGYINKPYLYGFSNLSANRVYVDGGVYRWKYPLHDEPCYIIEDLSRHDKPGIAQEKFKIKVNKAKYDNGYILAVDPHSPEQLLITEDEIIHDGDGVILTVKYVGIDPANRWFPKEYLRPNTKLFAIGTVGSEYSRTYSKIPTFGGGMREYMNTVGESTSQLHYEITRDAAYSKTSEKYTASLDHHREIIEMYRFRKGSHGYDMSMKGQTPRSIGKSYYDKYGKDCGKQMKMDTVQKLWIPKIEALGLAYLDSMRESKAIWGAGGQISFDGKTKQNQALGLFHQLNMGNQYNFNLYNFNIEKLEFIIAEKLKDRVEPFSNTGFVTTIKVGVGMYTLLRSQLNKRPQQIGATLEAKDVVQGLGKGNNTGLEFLPFQIDSWQMANGYGKIKMELVPGLDPTDANPQINPIIPLSKGIGGHRLSSYMIIIEDITSNDTGNIVELVHGADWDVQKRVIVGKLNYLGAPTFNGGVFNSASHHPGYQMVMEQRDKAYWVKDITKSLLIKPINPQTGRPIYDGYFRG